VQFFSTYGINGQPPRQTRGPLPFIPRNFLYGALALAPDVALSVDLSYGQNNKNHFFIGASSANLTANDKADRKPGGAPRRNYGFALEPKVVLPRTTSGLKNLSGS